MLRQIFLMSLLLLCASLYGQTWNCGIEAGYTRNKFHTSSLETKGQNGFKIGGVVNYNFRNDISLETGLAYEMKGGTLAGENIASQRIHEIKLMRMDYLNIPLLAGYKFHVGNAFSIMPQAGGYLNVGIGGYGFMSGTDPYEQPYTTRVDAFSTYQYSSYAPFNRIDAGILLAINLQYRKVRFKCAYGMGLNSIHSTYGSPNNRTLGASVIYMFRK